MVKRKAKVVRIFLLDFPYLISPKNERMKFIPRLPLRIRNNVLDIKYVNFSSQVLGCLVNKNSEKGEPFELISICM